MPLTAAARIDIIRECATLLDKHEWTDLDLILTQHGFHEMNGWSGTKRDYALLMIKDGPDERLQELHGYLTGEAGGGRPGASPWSGDQLRLFFSHIAQHRSLVGDVARELERYGVLPFVAHDSIEPSKEWQEVIEAGLSDCDAMIVFLHEGFSPSRWCDQEVGWALGRRRPVLPLNFGIHPYGFLGKHQDQPCLGKNPVQIAWFVLDWLSKTPSLHARLATGLVSAFEQTGSWDFTRSLVPYLERIDALSDDQLSRMEVTARNNIDVRECIIGPQSGPEWVAKFVAKRRGTTDPPIWPNSDEPPF